MEPAPTPASAIERAQKTAEQALAGATDPELKAARQKAKGDLGDLPAESPAKLTRTMSYLLDDLVPIPGTKLRFGIDPILSLVPWAGSSVGAAFGVAIMVDAIRLRAPVPVVARMGANSLLDWLLGLIPYVGPLFDAAFRSNKKNLKLLNRTIENRDLVRKASVRYWLGVVALVAVVLGIIITIPIMVILGLGNLFANG